AVRVDERDAGEGLRDEPSALSAAIDGEVDDVDIATENRECRVVAAGADDAGVVRHLQYGAVFGDDGQVLAVDQHLFLVGACGDQDRVAVTRRVDRLLDGGETARADQQHPAAVAVFDDLDVDE